MAARFPAGHDLRKEDALTFSAVFDSHQYVFGRKRAHERAARLLIAHALASGAPALSMQDALIRVLRVGAARALEPTWYLTLDTRVDHGRVRSVTDARRPAALAFAARASAASESSVGAGLYELEERVDPLTDERSHSATKRLLACERLLVAHVELLARREHLVEVVGASGACEAVCALSEPPHGQRGPPDQPATADELLGAGMLHAHADVARLLPRGAASVRWFERARAFECALKAELLRSAAYGLSPLVSQLALPAEGGGGEAEQALAALLDAVQARTDGSAHAGRPLVALVADASIALLLTSRFGFECAQVSALDEEGASVVEWYTLERATA
jgi:hypothetical protein